MTKNKIEHQRKYWEEERKRRAPEHPVIEAFAMPKVNYISDYVDLSRKSILDVGCGNGFFTYYFSKRAYSVGIDYSRHMISINPCDLLIQGSALALPFKTNSFDLVFCSNLLHHVKDPETVVREMKRISKKFVVLSEPNRNNPFMALFSVLVHEERGTLKFSLRYLKKLAISSGLNIVDACSLGSIVPNKTPLSLLGLFKKIDKKSILGFYSIVLARK
jgi:SAM-dependent methyltransferase